MATPRNIVLMIADSLRWDAVHAGGDHHLPYTAAHAITFHQARSGGCWTLPATASMFTGLMPHEHGATEQTRGLRRSIPTLAERLRALGYRTHMVTANVVTTEIFGLHRGFETIERIWQIVPMRLRSFLDLLALIGKPRLRHKLLSRDLLLGRLSADLQAAGVWLQSTMEAVFARTRAILRANEARGERTFLFLNLMETHFPYHVGERFQTSAASLGQKVRELHSLYHLVNQSWLTRDKQYIRPDMLQLLRHRQRLAWERLAPHVDAFLRELREGHGATVVFGADHGDNFGEQGWQYHFANVNDAGNRVPLFWLYHDHDVARIDQAPISSRDLFGALLKVAGDRDPALISCVETPERSVPIMQSYWYNNGGRTLERFRYNQFAFVAREQRFVFRHQQWYTAPVTRADEPELAFQPLGREVNPLYEPVDSTERLAYVRQAFKGYCAFSDRVMQLSLPGRGSAPPPVTRRGASDWQRVAQYVHSV
jgi:arylsulfatase A-like enzyme